MGPGFQPRSETHQLLMNLSMGLWGSAKGNSMVSWGLCEEAWSVLPLCTGDTGDVSSIEEQRC